MPQHRMRMTTAEVERMFYRRRAALGGECGNVGVKPTSRAIHDRA